MIWAIRDGEDGMLLVSWIDNGIREQDQDGKYRAVYTCLWCDHPRDAHRFYNHAEAVKICSGILGGTVVPFPSKPNIKHDNVA